MTGKQLKDKILETGIELKKVSDVLGITPQDLNSKLKSTDIKVDFLQNVARAINKSVYQLLGEDKPNAIEHQGAYLDIIRNCSEAARDAAFAAKESSLAVNKLIPANSNPTLEEKLNHLVEMIAAEKVGQVAVQTRLLREIAKRDGRKYEDVYNEFLDNELAEAAGVRTKANSRQGHENAGKRGKVQQTS